MSTVLIIILIVNVFIMGVIVSLVVPYIREHYQQKNKKTVIKPQPDIPDPEFPQLQIPPEIIQRISRDAEAHYQKVLANSAAYLQQGLVSTATDMNNLVKNLVTQIIKEELANYRQEMDQMRQKAETEMGGVKQEMEGHREELKAQLAQELAGERQKLVSQIDTKLADAVGSFLVETLGHDVDLGNQTEYLKSLLEEHKAEFIKEVGDQPAEPANAPQEAVDETKTA